MLGANLFSYRWSENQVVRGGAPLVVAWVGKKQRNKGLWVAVGERKRNRKGQDM